MKATQKKVPMQGTSNVLAALSAELASAAGEETEEEPEQLEVWKDAGFAATSQLSEADLDALGGSITAEAFGAKLHELTDTVASRFISDKDGGNAKTADRIAAEFKSLGMTVWNEPLQTLLLSFEGYVPKDAKRTAGVLGRINGTDLAAEAVLIGAHFDSVNWDDTSREAPGVDDNGSGVSLMLLIARALAESKIRLRRSVIFAAFNAEEEGMVGSSQIAPMVKAGKYGDVKSVIIADEIAWPGAGKESRHAIFETVGSVAGTAGLLDTFAHSVKEGDGVDGFLVNKHGFSSDHIPFLDRGIPTVLLIEGDNMHHADVWGHSARDTFDHVDFKFGASMSRLALRVAATIASPAE